MNADYYKILRVSPDADLETIKKAYRQRALESHPDHGGSHEQMLLINEAFQILSDPEARRHYDLLRSNQADEATRRAAAADAGNARQKAQDYPRTWPEFDSWLNAISKDISNANYGSWRSVYSLPTAGNSITGWVFIVVGFFGGSWVAYQLFGDDATSGGFKFVCMGIAAGGAWVGKLIHQGLGQSIKKTSGTASQQQSSSTEKTIPVAGENTVIACNNCGQKLRVTARSGRIRIKCRACNHEFDYPS
ncbi:MAG: DnaJ domain-containing protein [Verrucomicrobia bacterium]|nr:DnaJ domain-containing protein [Verrucomicrobiota bacterium]